MRGSRAAAAAGFGLVYGALFFGATLSLLHLIHNRIDSPRAALAVWLFFSLGAGSGCAALCAAGAWLRRLLDWLRDRSRASQPARKRLDRALLPGLAAFHIVFFLPVALYGLTYDQVPFGPPVSAAGMVLFLLLAAAVIVAGALLLAWLAVRLLSRPFTPGGSRLPLLGLLIVVVVHSAVVAVFASRPIGGSPTATTRPTRAVERAGARVVFIGFDGADWQVLRPLLERGELPAFHRLIEEGASGPLTTLSGANSAVIWASIYTGKAPSQHGILDFYRIRLPGMAGEGIYPVHRTFFIQATEALEPLGVARRRIVDRSSLTARPLWEILDELGLSVGLVDGYYFSVPARAPTTAGGYFFSYALNALSRRADRRARSLTREEVGMLVQPTDMLSFYLPHASRDDFYWQSATLLDLLAARPQPDFLHLYTHQPDAKQHNYWRWLEPRRYLGVDAESLARYENVIPDLYRDFDRFLGRLMDQLDPATTLVVASDHGHSPTLLHGYDTQHRHGPPGILLLWGAGVRGGEELTSAHVYDLAPTLLHLLGLPVAEDMRGRVLKEALTIERAEPDRRLASYEPLGRKDSAPSSETDLTAEELERLRALGYL